MKNKLFLALPITLFFSTPIELHANNDIALVDYSADDDGDNLLNGWEIEGYDADGDGVIDIDLPSMGANYQHKDVFVEMDYMKRQTATNGLGPNSNVIKKIEDSFAASPMTNPDGKTGINIHLLVDDEIPYDQDLNPVKTEFAALKDAYFDPIRSAVFHYMIWADQYSAGTSSGLSMSIPSSDFIVTLGAWNGGLGGTDSQKVGTFIHELGHNLGLQHGGSDSKNYKPNYLSVMNYFFQISGVNKNGRLYNYDYQRFALDDLDEASLNETAGLEGSSELRKYGTWYICPDGSSKSQTNAAKPFDWNCDGAINQENISSDINSDDQNTVLTSWNDWEHIIFYGDGSIGYSDDVSFAPKQLLPSPSELTFEEYLKIRKLTQGF